MVLLVIQPLAGSYMDFMGFKITRKDLRNFPENAVFSVASMGASVLGAIAGSPAGPVGMVGGAAAMGGAAAYRMDTNRFLRDFRESLDQTSQQQRGRPLSNAEFLAIAQSPEMQAAAKQFGMQIKGQGSAESLMSTAI